jgi:hypothetical protein
VKSTEKRWNSICVAVLVWLRDWDMREIRFVGLGLAHLKIEPGETTLAADLLPAKGLALLCYLAQTLTSGRAVLG